MRVKKPVRFSLFILFVLAIILMISACRNHYINVGNNTSSFSINNNKEEEAKYIVVIDPGHGGEDPGATGVSGKYEKDFTLSLSKKVAQILEEEPEIEVHMTREDDTFISSKGSLRATFANDLNADLYISIHGNTFTDPDLSGTQSYYFHDYSRSFAEGMHQHVVNATGFTDQGIKEENYYVLRDTKMPSVLLEIGYLTNALEEQKMLRDDFQETIAASIYMGIKEYLDL
jgi:N-acetylmuramoyl-L-alanine amidase